MPLRPLSPHLNPVESPVRLILDRATNTKLELSIPAGSHEVEVPDVIGEQLLAAGFREAAAPVADQPEPRPTRRVAKKAAAEHEDIGD